MGNGFLSIRCSTLPARHAAVACTQGAASPSCEVVEMASLAGIGASLENSLERRRESTAVVDVLACEDVGKTPDKKVAEALRRVSGVSISREFGEGERVSIRRAASEHFRTLLNGHTAATANLPALDQRFATGRFMRSTEVYAGAPRSRRSGCLAPHRVYQAGFSFSATSKPSGANRQ